MLAAPTGGVHVVMAAGPSAPGTRKHALVCETRAAGHKAAPQALQPASAPLLPPRPRPATRSCLSRQSLRHRLTERLPGWGAVSGLARLETRPLAHTADKVRHLMGAVDLPQTACSSQTRRRQNNRLAEDGRLRRDGLAGGMSPLPGPALSAVSSPRIFLGPPAHPSASHRHAGWRPGQHVACTWFERHGQRSQQIM